MSAPTTRWPEEARPHVSPVHARNELRMPSATPEQVWPWLIRAERWPEWYPNCKDLRIETGPGPDLEPGAVFAWTTFGVRVRTTVTEFVPRERLAWSGTGLGAAGYHSWTIEARDNGCLVVTEETQRGLVPNLGRLPLKRALLHQHQRWLLGLERRALTGPPR